MRTVVLFSFAVACAPAPEEVEISRDVHLSMPFDGEERYWEFVSTDDTVGWKLVAELRGLDPEFTDRDVYLIDHLSDCVATSDVCEEDAVLSTYGWTSDVETGVQLHRFQRGTADTRFDPPLQILASDVAVGDSLTTDTGIQVWTSTLVGLERCPTRLPREWSNQCLHFRLDDGDNDPLTGMGIVGDYWVAEGQGIVGIQAEDSDAVWELDTHECLPAETCDGIW